MLVHVKLTKVIALLLLSVVALSAIGARCIENTSVRKDASGRTHIYGEFYNDTDVQGVQIILSGKLLDAQGNVIAEAQGATCPPDTQPHSQSMFDISFPEGVTQDHASFEVRPIAGKALGAPLPDPGIELSARAFRYTAHDSNVPYVMGVALDFLNRSQTTPTNTFWLICMALYDPAGKVVGANTGPICWADNDVIPPPGGSGSCGWYMSDPPPEAVTLRAWVWFPAQGFPSLRTIPASPGGSVEFEVAQGATSAYQFLMSDKVIIQDVVSSP